MSGKLLRALGRYAVAAVLVFLVAAAALPARGGAEAGQSRTFGSLPRKWRHWKYFRSIDLPPTSAPRLVAMLVPEQVYTRAQSHLADLRIIDNRGREVPYAMITFTGSSRTTFLPSHHSASYYVPGSYTDFLLDLGPRPRRCNFLIVTAKATAANLAVVAQIDSSDDGYHWRQVRKSAALFGSQALNASPTPILHFPETTARFLRVRIYYRKGKFAIRTMAAGNELKTPADRIAVTGLLAPVHSSIPRASLWQISLHGPLPVDEVDFGTTEPGFSRRVLVFSNRNGRDWSLAGQGIISRVRHYGETKSKLSVGFRPVRSPLWRVEVENESDPPLANVRLRLSMTPQRIVFRQLPGRQYWLLYGESIVLKPRYELAQTVGRSALHAAPLLATAGARQSNRDWIDPRPWTEKHPAVLWVATILAGLLLALAALRAVRRPG